MITLKIGNKQTTVHNGKHSLTKLTTILLQPHNRIEIGLQRGIKNVIYDFVVLLGTRYQDEEFSRYGKFYTWDFWRGKTGKIQVGVPGFQGMVAKSRMFAVESLLALYLRKLLQQYKLQCYPQETTLKQLLQTHKFHILIPPTASHPTRYALKQALEIAGIESPIFLLCTHSALASFYSQYKQGLEESEEICVVEFGDRGAGVAVYRVQGWEERIVEVVQMRAVGVGGYHLTKILAEYVVEQIKEEKGIDISRHTSYMSLLHSECQKVKITIFSSEQHEAHIRIPDLPDNSTFGRIINQKQLTEILNNALDKVLSMAKDILDKFKNIKEVLLIGGSCNIGCFQAKVRGIAGGGRRVRKLGRDMVVDGAFAMKREEIVVFDVSDAVYQVTGEEGFRRKLMDQGEDVPDRRNEKSKFPAGQLEFNLKITENGNKIAHFLLDSRPSQNQFWLNFEIDRNKLIWLYVKTDKGKIDLIPNFQAIKPENLYTESQTLKQYQL